MPIGMVLEQEPAEQPASAEPKTRWDRAHASNRAERRRAFKQHASREERLQVFGTPTPRKAMR